MHMLVLELMLIETLYAQKQRCIEFISIVVVLSEQEKSRMDGIKGLPAHTRFSFSALERDGGSLTSAANVVRRW